MSTIYDMASLTKVWGAPRAPGAGRTDIVFRAVAPRSSPRRRQSRCCTSAGISPCTSGLAAKRCSGPCTRGKARTASPCSTASSTTPGMRAAWLHFGHPAPRPRAQGLAEPASLHVADRARPALTLRLPSPRSFPPDPSPNYWEPSVCPGAPLPSELSFACSEHIYKRVLSQTLNRPVGASYVVCRRGSRAPQRQSPLTPGGGGTRSTRI